MNFSFKKILVIFVFLIVAGFARSVLAANNIFSPQSYSQFLNLDVNKDGTNDFINWAPTNGGVTVSDTNVSGFIWGESVGWINLNPIAETYTGLNGTFTPDETVQGQISGVTGILLGDDTANSTLGFISTTGAFTPGEKLLGETSNAYAYAAQYYNNTSGGPSPSVCAGAIGVQNTCSGVLSGCAWGQDTGWINFAPGDATGANQPLINTTSGQITGTVWAQDDGYIQLSSPQVPPTTSYDPTLGLVTTWHGCVTPPLTPTNGVCGTSSGQTFSVTPVSNLCSSGTLSGFSSVTGGWAWDCLGSNGGTDANNCSATQSQIVIGCVGSGCNSGSGPSLNVVTHVINTHGGTDVSSDFYIYVKQGGVNLTNSPASGVDSPGKSYDVSSNASYVVSQDPVAGYSVTFGGNCDANGNVSFAAGFSGAKTCTITESDFGPQLCQDSTATNDGQPLPCEYALCMQLNANNYGQRLPCVYYGPLCQDHTALNYGGLSPCEYSQTCQDSTATNYGQSLPCEYLQTTCNDHAAVNYGAPLPCKYVLIPIGCVGTNCGNLPSPIPIVHSFPRWLLETLAVLGLAAAVAGLAPRVGNVILTIAFGRKRQRGIVFDSVTRQPLDPAYVTIIDVATNREIQSQITDMEGRYGFVVPHGTYRIVAGKTHYQFPSKNFAGRGADPVYENLYFGEPFTVSKDDEVATMNIPMDPLAGDWNQEEKRRMSPIKYMIERYAIWGWLLEILFAVGFIASLVITYYYPVWWNILMSALYVVIAILQVSVFGPISPGIVTLGGAPLANGIVHIYNKDLNREVARKVTTEHGSYFALVSKAKYYLVIDRKNADGTYAQVYTSDTIRAHGGVIGKSFDL